MSWVEGADEGPFGLDNLALGAAGGRCLVAIGDHALDATAAEADGLRLGDDTFCEGGTWDALIAAGPAAWARLREALTEALGRTDDRLRPHLCPRAGLAHAMPWTVAEFTDFYAGRHHAENVGTMFRGPETALPPNWLHMPIGYNGRASSVVISGTPVRRPWGQVKGPDDAMPRLAPSARFDFELELGAIVGVPSDRPLDAEEAEGHIFGYVLLNDWSARDIQAWEYQPLGPFQSKATATTISPWIVMAAALEPYRAPAPEREVPLLPHLATDRGAHEIDLSVTLVPEGGAPAEITRTNARHLTYSAAQQLAHHTTCGCPMRSGDLLGSGTISGPERDERGSMLELSWGGAEPLPVGEAIRSFLEDGDTVSFTGTAGGRIGFGTCTGTVRPAPARP